MRNRTVVFVPKFTELAVVKFVQSGSGCHIHMLLILRINGKGVCRNKQRLLVLGETGVVYFPRTILREHLHAAFSVG